MINVRLCLSALEYKRPIRTGNHIYERMVLKRIHRPGGINFSILGRGEGSMDGRDEYVKWDMVRIQMKEEIFERTMQDLND